MPEPVDRSLVVWVFTALALVALIALPLGWLAQLPVPPRCRRGAVVPLDASPRPMGSICCDEGSYRLKPPVVRPIDSLEGPPVVRLVQKDEVRRADLEPRMHEAVGTIGLSGEPDLPDAPIRVPFEVGTLFVSEVVRVRADERQ